MKAQEIKKDDYFVDSEGRRVWTALGDAEIVTVPTDFRLVRVIIQFDVDGGREPRYWDIDYDVDVYRP